MKIRPFVFKTIVAFLVIVSSLAGCAWLGPKEMPLNTTEALYEKGVEFYQKEKYKQAIEMFQRVKEEYPLSKYALMAELGIADSYFSDELYVEAEMNYSEFINLHPTNPNLPYVIYQLGMCHFKQMMTIDRDQTETTKAKKEFERLMAQYPSSKFAAASEQRLRDCKQRLAEHEFYVGRFYFRSHKYQAALKRFEVIARDFPNLGLDYSVGYYIKESQRLIEKENRDKQAQEQADLEKKKKEELKKKEKEKPKSKT
jgi:outer membrane protein assembly factor BamD